MLWKPERPRAWHPSSILLLQIPWVVIIIIMLMMAVMYVIVLMLMVVLMMWWLLNYHHNHHHQHHRRHHLSPQDSMSSHHQHFDHHQHFHHNYHNFSNEKFLWWGWPPTITIHHHPSPESANFSPQFSDAAENWEVPLMRLTSNSAWISSTFNCVNTHQTGQAGWSKER